MHLVGISGKAETGKDHLMRTCLQPVGFRPWSFAWHLKIEIIGQGGCTFQEAFYTKPKHVRDRFQARGTEEGRDKYGEDIWVDTTLAWLELIAAEWGVSTFVIPDVRFKNELLALQRLQAKVIRVVAPERAARSRLDPEQRQHRSEIDLDDVPLAQFDAVVHNNPGDVAVERQMVEHFKAFGWHELANELYLKSGHFGKDLINMVGKVGQEAA